MQVTWHSTLSPIISFVSKKKKWKVQELKENKVLFLNYYRETLMCSTVWKTRFSQKISRFSANDQQKLEQNKQKLSSVNKPCSIMPSLPGYLASPVYDNPDCTRKSSYCWQTSAYKIGLCTKKRPLQHSIGYMGDGFYRSKDPTNNIKVLKENLQNTNQTTETTQNTDIDIQ